MRKKRDDDLVASTPEGNQIQSDYKKKAIPKLAISNFANRRENYGLRKMHQGITQKPDQIALTQPIQKTSPLQAGLLIICGSTIYELRFMLYD